MKLRKVYAAVTAAACALSTMTCMPNMILPTYASEIVHDDFEVNYDGWDISDCKSEVTVEAVDGIGANGTRGMLVSNRKTVSDGTSSSKGLYLGGGVDYTYNFSVFSKVDSKFTINLTYVDEETGENSTTVNLIEEDVKGGEWTKLSTDFEAPEKTAEFRIDITNDNTEDFVIDDVIVTGEKDASEVSAAGNGLVSKFGGYFRVGNILNGQTVNNSGITANILKDCNAVECENETKPDATLPWQGKGASDSNIPVRSDSFAAIADFCAKNGLAFRGHTLVWHSQTPQWFFKNNFQDGGQWVSKSVMHNRLEMYIKNMFEMYKTKYPTLNLYAYDVCNECISDAGNGGPRGGGYGNGNSPWVQVYGNNDFIADAFELARKYAPSTCKLYYNDYNEFADGKKNSIINTILKPLKAKGWLDGMGMQSHLNCAASGAWGDTNSYLKAMDDYLALGIDVQVTELDLAREGNTYSEQQQADKYKAIFKHAMDYNDQNKGNKVSLVQIWGPNDSNTWVRTTNDGRLNKPLLYDENNQPKAAYNQLMAMPTSGKTYDPSNPGGDGPVVTPEPDKNNWWLHYTFEDGEQGWSSRGTATVASSSQNHYTDYGSKSLSISGRDANWCGAGITLPYYIKEGESYSFSAHVKYDTGGDTDFFCMKLQYGSGDDTHYDTIAEGQAVKGEWVQLSNPSFKIPAGAGGGLLYLETHSDEGTTCDFYADEVIVAVDGTGIAGEGSAKVVTYSTADLDGSGTVNVADYLIAKRLLKTGITNASLKKAADVDQSTKFDAEDVKLIWQFITMKIKEFPKAEVDYGDYDFTGLQNKFGNVTLASSWKKDGENNPCTTQRFGADPGWMVYKDRLYLYTTADEFEYRNDGKMQENTYASGYINVISTADMVNWTDHGQIPVAKTRTSGAIAKWANNAWAPDAAWKTIDGKDKFFLYFANNGSGIGVITADDPTFSKNVKDPLGHELISRSTPNSNVTWLFDPGVYYDPSTDTGIIAYGGGVPNGQAARTGQGRIAKLGDDMISIVGTPTDPGTPYLFEDSSMIKIGNTWYYSFCHNWDVPWGGATENGNKFNSADIGYMTSTDPLKGYQYQGVVFGNTGSQKIDNGGNNHHSVISFKNKLYVAYHSRQQAIRMVKGDNLQIYNSKGELSADGNYRSTQINEASMSGGKITCSGDMKGCTQIEKLDPFAKQQAETMQNQSKDIKISGLGDTVVNVHKGSWLKTTGVDFGSGASTLTVKASSKSGAVIKVATGTNAEAMTYVEVPAGGSTEITVPVVNSPTGSKDLFFMFNGDVDMDSWQFAK